MTATFQHRLIVTGVSRMLAIHRQQIDVAFFGLVETVPVGADETTPDKTERGMAKRATPGR
jgi:hypothetical protein